MHRIDIDSFGTLQEVIDDYNLSEWSNITQFFIELLQETFTQDIETVLITIKSDLIPISYTKPSTAWRNSIAQAINYPYLTIHKRYRGNTLTIQASGTHTPSIFKQRLIHEIQHNGQFKASRQIIPQSYQDQPYVILSRIRSQHNLNIKIRYQTSKYITYVQIKPRLV